MQVVAWQTATRNAANPQNQPPQPQPADEPTQADDGSDESDYYPSLSDLPRHVRKRIKQEDIARSYAARLEKYKRFGWPVDGRVPGGRRRATVPSGQSLGRGDNYQASQSLDVTQKERIEKKGIAEEEEEEEETKKAIEAVAKMEEEQEEKKAIEAVAKMEKAREEEEEKKKAKGAQEATAKKEKDVVD
jgi:colicin import membrane protein